jgi:hypothetical protein
MQVLIALHENEGKVFYLSSRWCRGGKYVRLKPNANASKSKALVMQDHVDDLCVKHESTLDKVCGLNGTY